MKMTKIAVMAAALAASVATFAENAFEFKVDGAGHSYLQINQDMKDFTFASNFGSVGNSGAVGYKVNGETRKGETYTKKDGKISMSNLSAGDRIDFYLVRKNGQRIEGWEYMDKAGKINFMKNGGTDHGHAGPGKDEWINFGEATITGFDYQEAGGPLPGALVVLLLGGAGLGGAKLRKRRAAKQA